LECHPSIRRPGNSGSKLSTVAAYRDRWKIGVDDGPLGSERPVAVTEAIDDLKRAQAALQRATKLGLEPQRHRAETHHSVGVGPTTECSLDL
jgi:hypothetical protein